MFESLNDILDHKCNYNLSFICKLKVWSFSNAS